MALKPANLAYTHPTAWDKRVEELEAEGLTRSDAQGVADAEAMKGADWASESNRERPDFC